MKIQLIALALAASTASILVARAAKVVAPAPAPAAPPVVIAKAPALDKQQLDFFETKVRPILVANCYSCHSADATKVKGGLLLDSREGLLKGGDSGPAIVPGDPLKSKLIIAIGYKDADLQMPPKGQKLPDRDIANLTAWVKMGAPDPRTSGAVKLTGLTDKARAHWAYQPVRMPAVPQVKDKTWVRTPVDAFVLSKLEQNGMQPSAPAPKETLIRRATYDLIGLPPTPEEVEAFVADTSPNAFAKVVDRLLASPHYGERWGRFWLDSARYSDTTGIEGNAKGQEYRYAHAWTYRDYVIRAFNDDKPYDQFLIEQIAADKLPISERDPSRLAALGFITVGKRFQNPNDIIDERIDALSKATMALTVSCARCHDHKFDPIPTADYYSLHGIFASTIEPGMKAGGKYGAGVTPAMIAAGSAIEAFADKSANATAAKNPLYADYLQKRSDIEQADRDIYYTMVTQKGDEFRKNAAGYLSIALTFRKADAAATLLARNALIAELKLERDIYQQFRLRPRDISVFGPLMRLADLPEEQFNAATIAPILTEIKSGKMSANGRGVVKVALNPFVVAAFKNVTPESLKSIRDVAAIYGKLFAEIEPKATAYVEANRHATTPQISGFDPNLVELIQIPAPVQPAAGLDSDKLRAAVAELPQQNQNAYNLFRFSEINELDLTHPGAPAIPMMVTDSPTPHNSPIFIRGEAQNRGPIVPRQFLEILSGPHRQPFTSGSGRLELAQAIASNKNPLTARVLINRLWMHHFGEGFVRTLDDMGVQSEPPSHPELLDYLASRFTQGGWSIKAMHRLIMLSNAYQQSSDTNTTFTQKEPENRLLWRANLRRLDFEAVRDTMLQFTGKIDLSMGGKPVNLTDEPYSNRRSVYGYIDRGNLPELMAQFDFSDPDMANSRRTSTIVPQQALFFMNSPMSVDVARKVASRPEFVAAKDDAARVKAIYEVLYQRAPRPEEIQFAMDYVQSEKDEASGLAGTSVAKGAALTKAQLARQQIRKPNPAAGGKNAGPRKAVQNQGDFVERKPLSPWELYAQTLLFTNEVSYVN